MKKIKGKYLTACIFISACLCLHPTSLMGVNTSSEAMDDMGNVIAVWDEIDSQTENTIILAATKPVLGNWSEPVVLSDNTTSAYSPAVALNTAGNGVVGWLEDDTTNSVTAFKATMFLFGGEWTTPERISATNENVSGSATFQISGALIPTVTATWVSYIGTNTFASVRGSSASFGGSWSSPTTISSQ